MSERKSDLEWALVVGGHTFVERNGELFEIDETGAAVCKYLYTEGKGFDRMVVLDRDGDKDANPPAQSPQQ